MDDLTLIKTRFALEDLNAAFTYLLDHDQVDDLADLFTEDAVYTHGERRSEGRTAIRALFATRSAAGVRTSRHMSSGLRLHIDSDSTARGTSVCMTFAYDGPPPITPATPYLVADFNDAYRLCADGRWRIAVRNIRRIFAAAGNSGPVGVAR
jgi:ketosteroid isomerase-like protein